MNPKVDAYLADGCGRCPLGGTPNCKVHKWQGPLEQLRAIALECGLVEELKWSHPCYTFQDSNVLLLGAFNDYCTLSFIKGALLADPHGILVAQTENVQSARLARFVNVEEVLEKEAILKAYIQEAIEVEKAGLKVPFKKTSEFAVPEELQQQLDADPALKRAFAALTPGRQRGYLLHFSAPKQSKTRAARVEKFIPKILEGKGWQD